MVRSFWGVKDIAGAAEAAVGLLVGWFVWTLAEYLLHRFFFHYHPRTERLKRCSFACMGCTTRSRCAGPGSSCRPS